MEIRITDKIFLSRAFNSHDSIVNAAEMAIEIYQGLLQTEVSPTAHCYVSGETAGSMLTLLKLQDDFRVFPFYGDNIASAACSTAVFAYVCSLMDLQIDLNWGQSFPEYNDLFTASVNAGCFLKEYTYPGDSMLKNTDSLFYWAYAELFRLTGNNTWLMLCCEYEEKIIAASLQNKPAGSDESILLIRDYILSVRDMTLAAVWALYKAGNAEFYQEQIITAAQKHRPDSKTDVISMFFAVFEGV